MKEVIAAMQERRTQQLNRVNEIKSQIATQQANLVKEQDLLTQYDKAIAAVKLIP